MLVAADDTSEVHPQGVQRARVLCSVKLVGNLFVVGADEVEDKAPVHERQQVIQEESQTAIQPLHKLHILVVSIGDVCADGTHESSDVVHKAVWETLTPGNVQFGGQE